MIDEPANELVTHFFRHESGKLVASLVRFFGLNHFELVEDMVQSALVGPGSTVTATWFCWRSRIVHSGTGP